jgi:hypothetical protein
MNEVETRAELIDPKLKENVWNTHQLMPTSKMKNFIITFIKINEFVKFISGNERNDLSEYVLSSVH